MAQPHGYDSLHIDYIAHNELIPLATALQPADAAYLSPAFVRIPLPPRPYPRPRGYFEVQFDELAKSALEGDENRFREVFQQLIDKIGARKQYVPQPARTLNVFAAPPAELDLENLAAQGNYDLFHILCVARNFPARSRHGLLHKCYAETILHRAMWSNNPLAIFDVIFNAPPEHLSIEQKKYLLRLQNHMDADRGDTILHIAASNGRQRDWDILSYFQRPVARGGLALFNDPADDVNPLAVRNTYGRTPYFIARMKQHDDLADLLVGPARKYTDDDYQLIIRVNPNPAIPNLHIYEKYTTDGLLRARPIPDPAYPDEYQRERNGEHVDVRRRKIREIREESVYRGVWDSLTDKLVLIAFGLAFFSAIFAILSRHFTKVEDCKSMGKDDKDFEIYFFKALSFVFFAFSLALAVGSIYRETNSLIRGTRARLTSNKPQWCARSRDTNCAVRNWISGAVGGVGLALQTVGLFAIDNELASTSITTMTPVVVNALLGLHETSLVKQEESIREMIDEKEIYLDEHYQPELGI